MQVKVRFSQSRYVRRSEVRNICRKSCANALITCVCGYCRLSSNRFAFEFLQYLLPPKTSEKLSLPQNRISSSLFIACFTISVNTSIPSTRNLLRERINSMSILPFSPTIFCLLIFLKCSFAAGDVGSCWCAGR